MAEDEGFEDAEPVAVDLGWLPVDGAEAVQVDDAQLRALFSQDLPSYVSGVDHSLAVSMPEEPGVV